MSAAVAQNRALSRLFGAGLLGSLRQGRFVTEVQPQLEALRVPGLRLPRGSVGRVLDAVYAHLGTCYRWEYYYKNELARQLLAAAPEAAVLYELRAGACLADCVLATPTGTAAYEVKTELDSLARLATQTRAYAGLYDQTYVVTHPAGVGALGRHLLPETGILVLDGPTLVEVQPAAPAGAVPFDVVQASYVLRQSELVAAHQALVGPLPAMGTALVWSYCQQFYLGLPVATARRVLVEALHQRRPAPLQRRLYARAPASLGVHLLRRPLPARQCRELATVLGVAATV